MIASTREKFDLPADVSYLNTATVAPLMTHLAEIGKAAVDRKLHPYNYQTSDWFEPSQALKEKFARLIQAEDADRVAIIPAVSYGVANAARNIALARGEEILIIGEQFPSNYYSWKRLADASGGSIHVVTAPDGFENRGERWNAAILAAISDRTRVVIMGNLHWTDGTMFDLEAVSRKAKAHGALLIVDGSQSIGALPFDVNVIQPDALFCVGYKWLLGPFCLGLAYYGPYFDQGEPIEENWLNRAGSDDFQALVDYTPTYREGAGRYNMGESANLHLLPILDGALAQLQEWGVESISQYAREISRDAIAQLRDMGCQIETDAFRAPHLFGIRFGEAVDIKVLEQRLQEEKVYVALRGSAVRVSVNLFNEKQDLAKLVACIQSAL